MSGPKIKPKTARRLYRILMRQYEQHGHAVWSAGSKIKLGEKWYFKLHYDVIGRHCERHESEIRFEWIKKLRDFKPHSNLNIYTVEATLTPTGLKKRGYIGKQGQKKERIIKHRLHNNSAYTIDNPSIEYEMAKASGGMHMKKPVTIGDSSVLVMKKFPGSNLYRLLYESHIILSPKEKIALTCDLFKAYYRRIYLKGLIHRDLKPENIMVALHGDGRMDVNIIDFGLTVTAGSESHRAGTPGYMPPEVFFGLRKQHVSHDIFSLACVIAEIWGISRDMLCQMIEIQAYEEAPGNWRSCLTTLFMNGTPPSEHAQELIKSILYKMLDPDYEARMPLIAAKEAFLHVQSLLRSGCDIAMTAEPVVEGSSDPQETSSHRPPPPSALYIPSFFAQSGFFSHGRQTSSMPELDYSAFAASMH